VNKGKVLTTEPLKSLDEVQRVRAVLDVDPRGLALFSLGTNSALRASDILKLRRKDLRGNELFIREKKTGKLRRIALNEPTVAAINTYLATRADTHEWLFVGQRGKMTHGYLGKLVRSWFAAAEIDAKNVASHSMRKTFVRLNHEVFGVSLGTLMVALNHSTERQTLAYCGLTAEDVEKAYANVI
jgi:integrase